MIVNRFINLDDFDTSMIRVNPGKRNLLNYVYPDGMEDRVVIYFDKLRITRVFSQPEMNKTSVLFGCDNLDKLLDSIQNQIIGQINAKRHSSYKWIDVQKNGKIVALGSQKEKMVNRHYQNADNIKSDKLIRMIRRSDDNFYVIGSGFIEIYAMTYEKDGLCLTVRPKIKYIELSLSRSKTVSEIQIENEHFLTKINNEIAI